MASNAIHATGDVAAGDATSWFVRIESRLATLAECLRPSRALPSSMLKVSEAARLLRVSEKTVRRYIEAGELKATALELGRSQRVYRIQRRDLEAFLDGKAVANTASGTGRAARLIRVPRGLV